MTGFLALVFGYIIGYAVLAIMRRQARPVVLATNRPREHLASMLGERADAEAVCARLGLGDPWDPALTRGGRTGDD